MPGLDPAAARRIVIAARTADRLPQLGCLLTAGKIGIDHVAAVGYGALRVPPEILTSADDTFAELAAAARPAELRAAAQRLQACYDQDAVATDATTCRRNATCPWCARSATPGTSTGCSPRRTALPCRSRSTP